MANNNLKSYGKHNRIKALDTLRGSAMIFVMVYHLLYDLVYFKGINIPFFHSDAMEVIHQFFLIILFMVSGVCTSFSKNSLKRGAIIFFIGEIVTIVSLLAAPNNAIIFGVLSFFGCMMMICDIIKPVLQKIPYQVLFIISIILFIVLFDFKNGKINLFFTQIKINFPNVDYLYPIAITSDTFKSADYFPLIPHGFIFLAGVALAKPIKENKFPKWFYKISVPVIDFLGRHSLIVYAIHQPIFLAFMYLL